jgi:DNA-directed RNA polymerase subunit RPC12/RpoP
MSSEVRRCSRCQQPAVTLVSDWKHSVWGGATGTSTRDYRCQACGAKFTIHPGMNSIALVVAGVLMLPIFIGIVPLLMAWRRSKTDAKNPIVPGEPLPQIRYRDGPPLRECHCGGTAVAAKITRRRHNGVPVGIEIEYACGQCQKGFTIESAWGQALSLFFSLMLFGLALFAYSMAETPLGRWGWAVGLSLAGLLLAAQFVNRLRNRFAHPAKPDLLLE